MHDVVVVGAGPAGWAAAAACAEAGLDTVLVAPDLGAPWAPTYAAWHHEVAGTGLPATVWRASWDEVVVVGRREHRLPGPYGVFRNDELQRWLWERAADAGAAELDASALAVTHAPRSSLVRLGPSDAVEARLVVDATGAASRLLAPGAGPGAAQVAHGILAEATLPASYGPCVLMDWRAPGGPAGAPSFLYALDLGADGWLLEETSLAGRPPVPEPVLEDRLHARLHDLGAVVGEVRAVEHVHIAVGAPVPAPQRVVATGAAGGLVHPATGYSVAASLRAAPRLARAVAEGLARRATADALAAAAWQAVWPSSRRRARALEDYGLGALLRLGQEEAAAFFDAFFTRPPESWTAYLAGTASPAEVASLMRGVFVAAPWRVRAQLAAGDPRRLAGGLRRR